MNDIRATMFDLQRGSFVDGPGIRTTVFFKGCNLDCKWCHNPESKLKKPQLLFYKDRCKNCGLCKSVCHHQLTTCSLCGKCATYCPNEARVFCGKEYSLEELFLEIARDKEFYSQSGGGVTFSGGECMLRSDFLAEICKKCKENNISTAIDTAGNVDYKEFLKVMPVTDIFLYDIKCIDEQLHVKGTGVSNERILQNLKRLSKEFKGEIIVRVPVIGGFNDDETEMKKIADFIKECNIKQTELLPYNPLCEIKAEALDKKIQGFYKSEKMEQFKKLFPYNLAST